MPLPDGNLSEIGPLAASLCGRQLPGGEFTITPAVRATVAELGAPLEISPHPIFSSIISLKSLGISIGELCRLCQFDLADGPLLGECSVSFERTFTEGMRYSCTTIIDSLERTKSRRYGVLDRLRFTVSIDEPSGSRVATVRYLWLLPRGNARD